MTAPCAMPLSAATLRRAGVTRAQAHTHGLCARLYGKQVRRQPITRVQADKENQTL